MSKSYKVREDLTLPIHLPDGSVISKPAMVFTGPRWMAFCPEFLVEIAEDDPARMITEDVPNSTPKPPLDEDSVIPVKIPVKIKEKVAIKKGKGKKTT